MKTTEPKCLKLLAALLLATSAGLPASAHHSFAEFDAASTVVVEGVVEEFRLVNPHAMMTLIATDANGATTNWKVQFDGRLNLSRFGWTPETFRTGERLVLTGNPAKTGSPFMFFNSAVREDGTAMLRPQIELRNTVEEERRLRRLEREKQE